MVAYSQPLKVPVFFKAGSNPARASEDFPLPDDPVMNTARASFTRLIRSSTNRSRPKNLGRGRYRLRWHTRRAWRGSCKLLRLDLGEGITRDAIFRFRG